MRYLKRFGATALLVLLAAAFVNAGVSMAKQYPADGTAVALPPPPALTRTRERDSIIRVEARRAGVPAELAVAVSHVEDTSGDSLALSNRGAVGIMQVLPTYWLDAFPNECYGGRSLFDRARNACVGVHVLRLYHARYGTWTRTFCAYHGSSGDVCQKYTESILSSLQ